MTAPRARREGLFLAGVFLLALAVRLAPLPAATRGGLRLLSPDCYGHLRRSLLTAHGFPRVPVLDPYLNHPEGGVWIWPPLFDLFAGGTARILFGRGVTQAQMAAVGASLAPLLGALQILPLFALARRVLSRRRARIAVLAYALLPAAVVWSGFGHFDHHVAEALVLLLVLLAFARAARRESDGAALLAGASLALALFLWQGAVFAALLALGFAAFALPERAALAAASSATLLAAGTALTLPATPVPFTFVSFGWFQPALLAAAAVPLALLGAWHARGGRRATLLGLAALSAIPVAATAGPLAQALLRGTAHVASRSPDAADAFANGGYLAYPPDLLRTIAECQPLLRAPWGPTLLSAVGELSPGLLLLPFLLFVLVHRPRAGPRSRRTARLLVALFGAALLVMTLLQLRNVYYLALFSALALAEGVARLAPRRLRGAAPLAAAALVLLAGAPRLARTVRYADAPGRDLFDTLARLRALDPPPHDAADPALPAPGTIPGVMAPWAAGHFVTAGTGRPAAADPFGYGWRRQCRLFSATDPSEARRILEETRCRYLVTTDLLSVLPAYAAAAGRAGTPPLSTFAARVHFAPEAAPFPFLERVLDSRTAAPGPDGRLVPRFRVFRVVARP